MKKRIFILALIIFVSTLIYAQVPEKLNYQAVIRSSTGELISNQTVQLQVTIINQVPTGTPLYTETHNSKTNGSGVVSISIGGGTIVSGNFSQIQWGEQDKYLGVKVDVGEGYVDMGTTQLLSVPYSFYSDASDSSRVAAMSYNSNTALFANEAAVANVLGSNAVYSPSSDTLFVVKDQQGNVVFAVFPDGAEVIVNETAKGKVGGFAVSGRSPSKADLDIFRITPDSARIYLNDTVHAKGKVGGFAVSGRSPSKGVSENILYVTADSTRVYVNDASTSKGKVGGFAVSGRSPSKGVNDNILYVTADSTRIYTQDTISGFGIRDKSLGGNTSYLKLTPLNYFIGHRAGESITTGRYNTFIGYETGLKSTWGDGNMFIGFNAGQSNVDGEKNIFIGNLVGYNFTGINDGEENIFIGSDAGKNCITTANSIFIGTRSGLNCGASYGNTFVGDRTASIGVAGDHNTLLGSAAGFRITGSDNVFIGAYSGNSVETGTENTFVGYSTGSNSIGSGNVFIGANAGDGELGSYKLYIASNDTTLIYGDFSAGNERVQINGDLHAVGDLTSTSGTVTAADYVFEVNYDLETIEEHAHFMWTNKHLPALKSDAQIKNEGKINLNERRESMLEELEKAHIYIEQLNNEMKLMKVENEILKQKLNEIIELLGN